MKYLLVVVLMLCSLGMASAQKSGSTKRVKIGDIGLAASIVGGDFGINVPIRMGSKSVIMPSLSIKSFEERMTDITIGLSMKFYTSTSAFKPYFSPRLGTLIMSPEHGDSVYDFYLGLGFGGEYFLSKHLSFGVEAQLNLSKSDKGSLRFGNPGNFNINTATMVYASIWF